MGKNEFDIKDTEFRIIGQSSQPAVQHQNPHKPWLWILLGTFALVVLCWLIIGGKSSKTEIPVEVDMIEDVVFEPMNEVKVPEEFQEPLQPLGDYSDTTLVKPYTEHLRDTINDIPIDIYIPHNAVPELMVGVPDLHDKSIILTTQAADIRADNGKIVGAFVKHGEPLSWGLSKKGYCGIIDGKVTVGVSDNSPLFEEATEKGGHFFRQYPLVDNGELVENEPKGKSIRKALCDRGGEIMVIMTQTPESFHDFAQALVDMKVDNAIYLVGAASFGYFRDRYDHLAIICNKYGRGYRYENFIVWR
jgi:hypothetical protein